MSAPAVAPPTTTPLAALVGADLHVPTSSGTARFVNLDNAATSPALASVQTAIADALDTYGSVHRGTGHTAVVSTARYAAAREAVGRFVNRRSDDHVIFTRNTTDALNLLARALPPATTVLGFPSEHHANLLPWRRGRYLSLGFPSTPVDAVARVERALVALDQPGPVLVAVTGASNVTGELWPVDDIVEIAHRHGARVVVDAAQLAPHRAIDLQASGLDYVAFSGHKLYAPYGSGALVGRSDWLDAAEPYLPGGGAVEQVGDDEVTWLVGPERHEGGTPNLLGAVGLAEAATHLQRIGFDAIAIHEDALADLLSSGLRSIPGVRVLTLWDGAPRIGVTTFVVDGLDAEVVAAGLAAEGVGVRHGSFCAHPLIDHLTDGINGSDCEAGGAVRASLGIGSSSDDVDRFLTALAAVVEDAAS